MRTEEDAAAAAAEAAWPAAAAAAAADELLQPTWRPWSISEQGRDMERLPVLCTALRLVDSRRT